MATVLEFPTTPREYIMDNGSNLVDRGYKWMFGLPEEGEQYGNECGALPFREELGEVSGINAPRTIRGEDWEFFYNWVSDRFYLPGFIWGDRPAVQIPTMYKGPHMEMLSSMYFSLSALSGFYGRDFPTMNMEVQSVDDAMNTLKGWKVPVIPVSTIPDPNDDRLTLSTIHNYFQDLSAMKCTIGDATAWRRGGQPGIGELYQFWYRYGEPARVTSYFLSSIDLDINYDWNDRERQIQFDVQFVGCFTESISNSETPGSYRYVLANISTKNPITQNLDRNTQFKRIMNWGGTTAANLVASVTGNNIRPDPPQYGWVSYTASLEAVWAVLWPKYLQF